MRLYFILFILSLIASAFSDTLENDIFIPNDPPRRSESTLVYQPITVSEGDHSFQTARQRKTGDKKTIHTITYQFSQGRQLTGRVSLFFDQIVQHSDSIAIEINLLDGGERIRAVQEMVQSQNSLSFNLDGIYAGSCEIIVQGYPFATNPLVDVQLTSIQLADAERLMILGDSITDGKFATDNKGYRHKLYDKMQQEGYTVDFVGDFGTPPYEGHFQGAMKTSDFYPKDMTPFSKGRMDVTKSMNKYRPTMVAIHLGTNDLNSETGFPISPYGEGSTFFDTQSGEMATLIDYLLNWHDGTNGDELEQILVSLIVPIKYRDSICIEFNQQIARMVNDFRNGDITGKAEPVYLVDQFGRFREWPGLIERFYKPLMFDYLHPNNAGHKLMSQVYFTTISELLSGPTWFTDISWYAEIPGNSLAYNGDHAVFENQGVAIADVTGDGYDDIYMTCTNSYNQQAIDYLYVWEDKLPYIESAEVYGIDDIGESRGSVFVDIDSDGDYDLFNGNSGERNRLYRNEGNRRFQDISRDAGIADLRRVTTGVLAADFDGDEDMDLYAVNSRHKNELYINDGMGRFELQDRGADDVVEASVPSLDVSAADFDNDGDIDIYICKRDAPNKLFVNDGQGYFIDKAQELGVDLDAQSNGSTWCDIDHDGDVDLFVALTNPTYETAVVLQAYENRGSGAFVDRSAILNIETDGYSPIIADFDNDGDDDIISTLQGSYANLYEHTDNWTFDPVSDTGAEIHGGDIRGCAVFDYDNDGDLDIIAARADAFSVMLRNNQNLQNNYSKIAAYGPTGDIGGYGTKLWLFHAGQLNDQQSLLQHRQILTDFGHISQNSPTQQFGMGLTTRFDLLAQFIDGSWLALRDLVTNQLLTISPTMSSSLAGSPAQISAQSGNQQEAVVGTDLPQPLEVKVVDDQGLPVPGARIDFEKISGDADLYTPATSNHLISLEAEAGRLSGGIKKVRDITCSGQGFVMNPLIHDHFGQITLQHTFSTADVYYGWLRLNNPGQTRTIQFDCDRTVPITVPTTQGWEWIPLSEQGFDLETGAHLFSLEIESHVIQLDKILWTKDQGYVPSGLENQEEPYITDVRGIAGQYVKLGKMAGIITIHASLMVDGKLVPDSPIVFTIKALPGQAANLVETSGNGQTGEPDIPLAEPFVVTVYDALFNPVSDISVNYTVQSGGGTLIPDSVVVTDEQGRASTTLVPGKQSSIQIVRAKAENITGTVTFRTTVEGVANELVVHSGGNQSGKVSTFLPEPVIFQTIMDDGKPASEVEVFCRVTDKGALISPIPTYDDADTSLVLQTDENGYVTLYWQLGEQSGQQNLVIDAGGIIGSPATLTAQALADDPQYLIYMAGNNQKAGINTQLKDPLQVQLRDRFGNGTPGYPVLFSALQNDGSFAGESTHQQLTDSLGYAEAYYTLGSRAGTQPICRTWAFFNQDTLSGSPVEFTATALADNATFCSRFSGDGQQGVVDTDLENPFVIKITDEFDNPVSGYEVTFSVVDGDGDFAGETTVTAVSNNQGQAKARYHIGRTSGRHRIVAQCPGLTPQELVFTVTAFAADPHELSYISGNDQAGIVNTKLTNPFVVKVRDAYGNGVPSISVQWTVTGNEGSFEGNRQTSILTTADGTASIYFTLGSLLGDSLYTAAASCRFQGKALLFSPISFVASARVGEPHRLVALSPTEGITGTAHHEPADPIKVKVVDKENLPIGDFSVLFTITSGGGRFAENESTTLTAETDNNGVAQARWVLGELGVEQLMYASAQYKGNDLAGSPVHFHAKTVEADAERLELVSGNNQNGSKNSPLPEPFVVRVLDDNGNPFAAHPVIFTVKKGDGLFTNNNSISYIALTSQEGIATALFQLGNDMGRQAYVIQVRSFDQSGVDLQNSPLTIVVNGVNQGMQIISGNHQTGRVNSVLPNDLTVKVNQNGVGIEGVDILFSLQKGSGEFITDSTTQTDTSGLAKIRFKLGRVSGKIHIQARAPQLGSHADFYATALPGTAQSMTKISGDNQVGIAGHLLPQPLVVMVTDAYGNPVPDIVVDFTPQQGHGVVFPDESVQSDSSGRAAVTWQLGSIMGEQYVYSANSQLDNSPQIFSATTLENHPPEIIVPDSFVVDEGQSLSFSVKVRDPENDSVSVTLQNIPVGADYHFEENRFTWTPTYEQAGIYFLLIQATDALGAQQIHVPRIRVNNINRAPEISLQKSRPTEHQLGSYTMPGYIDFYVHAEDKDGDPLFYVWKVNGEDKASSPNYRFQSQIFPAGQTTVEAMVFDHQDTVSTVWFLELITAIQLKYFSANFEPYIGIDLEWATGYEWQTSGYYIQRATQKDGPFTTVSPLIRSSQKGNYSYTDEQSNTQQVIYYRLQSLSTDGQLVSQETITVEPQIPGEFQLHQNYPNPFNPSTTLHFDIAEPSRISLVIYDVTGRLVFKLIEGDYTAGFHSIAWDGVNQHGIQTASGVYYAVLSTPVERFSVKMVLLH